MAYEGNVLRGNIRINTVLVLERKMNGAKTQGCKRRNWTDDTKELINVKLTSTLLPYKKKTSAEEEEEEE